MPEISKEEKQLEWTCRVLMIVDLLLILSGYLSYFQAKYQLVSPLIPKEITAQILFDGYDAMMKACLAAGIIFIPGLLLYSFRRKTLALIFLGLTIICFAFLRL
jgi:hypothetical protein